MRNKKSVRTEPTRRREETVYTRAAQQQRSCLPLYIFFVEQSVMTTNAAFPVLCFYTLCVFYGWGLRLELNAGLILDFSFVLGILLVVGLNCIRFIDLF